MLLSVARFDGQMMGNATRCARRPLTRSGDWRDASSKLWHVGAGRLASFGDRSHRPPLFGPGRNRRRNLSTTFDSNYDPGVTGGDEAGSGDARDYARTIW